jgi:hypothetical protein
MTLWNREAVYCPKRNIHVIGKKLKKGFSGNLVTMKRSHEERFL